MPTNTHLSPETLVEFHAERLTEAEDQRIEEHLAECEACADVSRRVFRLSAAWDQLMTPTAHWATAQDERAAVTTASSEAGWLDQLVGTLQGAALITVEGARLTIKSCARLATTITPPSWANIDALLNRNATWSFDWVPEPARSAERDFGIAKPGEIRPEASLPTVIETKATHKGKLRVAVDRATKQIVVTIHRFPPEPERLPTVKLMRKTGSTMEGSWTARPTRDGFRDLRAVFAVQESDEYVVGTE